MYYEFTRIVVTNIGMQLARPDRSIQFKRYL